MFSSTALIIVVSLMFPAVIIMLSGRRGRRRPGAVWSSARRGSVRSRDQAARTTDSCDSAQPLCSGRGSRRADARARSWSRSRRPSRFPSGVGLLLHLGEQLLPGAVPGPPVEPLVDRVPLPEPFRNVTPRRTGPVLPRHPLDSEPVIRPRPRPTVTVGINGSITAHTSSEISCRVTVQDSPTEERNLLITRPSQMGRGTVCRDPYRPSRRHAPTAARRHRDCRIGTGAPSGACTPGTVPAAPRRPRRALDRPQTRAGTRPRWPRTRTSRAGTAPRAAQGAQPVSSSRRLSTSRSPVSADTGCLHASPRQASNPSDREDHHDQPRHRVSPSPPEQRVQQ